MGRDKGVNRTKGNAKPANSGRSAELLHSFGGKESLIPTTLLGGSSHVPILGSADEELQLETNLTNLIRKLAKKDPTTKIKALGELNEICTADPEICTQILKYWPNYYTRLARDEDRKVRELSHVTLQSIANNVGRNLATQIKNIFPVWFLSTSDTFPVVATKAQSVFLNIFPTVDKQVQVCRFCSKEIFAFIRNENMFLGSELNKVTALEAILKLIQMGVCDDDAGNEDGGGQGNEGLEFDLDLESDAFWNLGKDESALVRRSFYTLLTLLAEKKLESLGPKKQRLNQIMKTSLTDEKSELEALWNCFLTLIMKGFYPDKLFAKKQILICLKNGFYGNANILGPLLLPLVAKVGPFAEEEVFIALGKGFDLENGTIEGAAIMRTYAEILTYNFQTTKTVPVHTFPFLFQNLEASAEFGRVIGNMLKSSPDIFYAELIRFIDYYTGDSKGLESITASATFGQFILSFVEPVKRKTKFREFEKSDSDDGKNTCRYDNLDHDKKFFMKEVSRKLLQWKAWKPFSVLSRSFGSKIFFKDIASEPKDFVFTSEDKVEGLRITLDQLKFEDSGSSTQLFQDLVSRDFAGENVSLFLPEINDFDAIPVVAEYIHSNAFLSNQHPAVIKYVLRKGVSRFPLDVINSKINELCDSPIDDTNLQLIQEIMNMRFVDDRDSPKVDLSRIYFKIWQFYLDVKSQQTEKDEIEDENMPVRPSPQTPLKIENMSKNILRNNRLPKEKLLDKVFDTVSNCHNIVGLDNLVEIALQITDDLILPDRDEFKFDPDFLVFLGFCRNLVLEHEDISTTNPDFDDTELKNLLKSVYFESRIIVQLYEEREIRDAEVKQLVQLGLNLLFGVCAYEVWKQIEVYNWDWKGIDFCDALNTELTRVLELLATPQNLSVFWYEVNDKCADGKSSLWASKYPEKYLMDLCLKMELNIPTPTGNVPVDFDHKTINYLQHPEANVDAVLSALTKERTDFPNKFMFETLFGVLSVEEQRTLLNYLAVATELLKRDPEFVSTAACWISAWLRFAKTIGSSKIAYLWVQKLNEAVVLIDSISKTIRDSDFVQEYVEFHARNIYPVVYSHFIQLNAEPVPSESDPCNVWKFHCATTVCSAVALTPTPILLTIEPDSSIIFEVFTPVLVSKSPPFKLAAYHIMRRTKVKDEVIIPKELSELLGNKVQNEDHDQVLTLLLGWDTLLKSQLNTFELANFVKKGELLPKLLNLAFFKLIPEAGNLRVYFDTKPSLKPSALPLIEHLSCYIVQEILRSLPYTVRWWWSLHLNQQRKKIIVEKIITKYLSSKLAAEELGKVQWNESQDSSATGGASNSENVTVDSHPGCNELIAKYKIEETNVVLKITLPLNHPLGAVQVHISDRKLHAKITQLLNTRSHSLSSGLKLWKENLDNTYKDVDECAICFFILHHVTKALPKLACSQCRKKFHAACLYKWFSTSNKSECPLCRNLF